MAELMEVLLVEDNEADVRLTVEALKDAKVANRLNVVCDGDSALRYLRREGEFTDAARPDLIVLDLNLPGRSGIEVLSAVKGDASLRRIPVAILTTSAAEADILKSYDLGANCYLTKPLDLDRFADIVHAIDEFWLGIVRLASE